MVTLRRILEEAGHKEPTEAEVQHDIRKAIGALPDVRLWRNNTGQLKDRTGKATIRYGLAVGSSDLVGVVAPHGRWLAIEVKSRRGKPTPEQSAWLEVVRKFGGVSGVARSVEDAMRLVEEARGGTEAPTMGEK